MKKIQFLFCIILLASCSQNRIKIACIGDSITEGYGTSKFQETSYPSFMQQALGNKQYTVLNAGKSGTTLRKGGDYSYWVTHALDSVFVFQPNIVVIQLGTNDTKTYNWNSKEFKKDYQALIDTLSSLSSQPKIYMVLPVPVYYTKWTINDSILINYEIPILKQLAKENNLPVIDAYHEMQGLEEHFPDGVHPDDEATQKLAGVIQKGLDL